jgi:serine phosphatase RsbU (regulator of sigma subunit)
MTTGSSLPVGIFAGAVYEEETVSLNDGDSLVFYTDGVLEARNSAGELYGFERLHTLMAPRPGAAEIAAAACAFGQDDDITILAVERVAVRERELLETALTSPSHE